MIGRDKDGKPSTLKAWISDKENKTEYEKPTMKKLSETEIEILRELKLIRLKTNIFIVGIIIFTVVFIVIAKP
jgi:hypothetical protein